MVIGGLSVFTKLVFGWRGVRRRGVGRCFPRLFRPVGVKGAAMGGEVFVPPVSAGVTSGNCMASTLIRRCSTETGKKIKLVIARIAAMRPMCACLPKSVSVCSSSCVSN